MLRRISIIKSIINKLLISHPLLILLIIFIFGFILRIYNFTDNFYFGHDQARDILRIYEMINIPKFKIVGPETDIPGLFSGPLYYYLLGIVYFISNFNPNAGVLMHILINLTGIPLLYYFGSIIHSKKFGLIAALLWAASFEQINYSHWLSNPAFVSILTMIFFLGLYLFFIKKKQIGLPISIIGYGLSTQLDFYLIYLFILYPIMYLLYPSKPDRKSILQTLIAFTVFFSTFIIAEIKFDFLGIKSFLGYLTNQDISIDIFERFSMYILGISKSLYYSLYVLNNFYALFLFIVLVTIVLWKYKYSSSVVFLGIWLASTFPLFGFTKTNIVSGTFVHGSIQGAVTLWVAYGVYTLFKMKKYVFAYIILFGIIAGNILLFTEHDFNATIILGHQNWTYKDQKNVVAYTYEASRMKPFSICSVSNPLFINNHWSTVYFLNGQRIYGYMPVWTGPDQEEDTFFLKINNRPKIRFLILDPSNQLLDFAYRTTIYAEDQISVLDEEKKIGEIIVQRRHIPDSLSELKNSQNLTNQEIADVQKILSIDPRYSCR